MAQTAIYKLAPLGSFHFGERGIGVEETADMLHSDTLFAAIASAWRLLGKPTVPPAHDLALLEGFAAGRPPFLLSSALPYAGDILLYPKPQGVLSRHKGARKVEFVSQRILLQLPQLMDHDPGSDLPEAQIQAGRVWVTAEESQRIQALLLEQVDLKQRGRLEREFERDPASIRFWWGSQDAPAPHVAIDRVSSRSNLYYAGELRFAPGCGLYFWTQLDDPSYRQPLEEALDFLQDEGLGGRRSTGHGQFRLTRVEQQLPAIDGANRLLTLALYHPRADEVGQGALRDAAYRRIMRRGWLYSPDRKQLWRKGLWMLAEGAVLSQPVLGDLSDVRPDLPAGMAPIPHPVWRYGYALTLPIRLEEQP